MPLSLPDELHEPWQLFAYVLLFEYAPVIAHDTSKASEVDVSPFKNIATSESGEVIVVTVLPDVDAVLDPGQKVDVQLRENDIERLDPKNACICDDESVGRR